MLWYRAEIGVSRNRKVIRLANALGLPLRDTVGLLHLFWCAVAEQAEDGNITDWRNEDICHLVHIKPDVNLLNLLMEIGFIDGKKRGMYVHGWNDRNGKALRERERVRNYYAKATRSLRTTNQPDVPTDDTNETNQTNERPEAGAEVGFFSQKMVEVGLAGGTEFYDMIKRNGMNGLSSETMIELLIDYAIIDGVKSDVTNHLGYVLGKMKKNAAVSGKARAWYKKHKPEIVEWLSLKRQEV